MTFPTIRPADVPRIPAPMLLRLRRQLADECAAAAIRHREILAGRRLAEALDVPADPLADLHADAIDVVLPVPGADLQAARDRRRRAERRAERAAVMTAHLHRPAADAEGRAS